MSGGRRWKWSAGTSRIVGPRYGGGDGASPSGHWIMAGCRWGGSANAMGEGEPRSGGRVVARMSGVAN